MTNDFSRLLILVIFIASTSLSHAQDSIVIVTAQAQGLNLVSTSDFPNNGGTFWLVFSNGVLSPYPCPPQDADLPVFQVTDSEFLVDATGGLVTTEPDQSVDDALSALADNVANLISKVQGATPSQGLSRGGAHAMVDLDPNDAGNGDGDSNNGFATDMAAGLTFTTNQLWLQITGTTNYGTNLTAYLVIHPPWNVTNGVYDLYFITNLNLDPTSTFSSQWSRIERTTPGQTNLVVTNLPPAQGFFRIGPLTNAIRPGFNQQFLAPNDDNCSGGIDGDEGGYGTLLTNLLATLPFTINFFGSNYSHLYVNNNGNVTFDTNNDTFSPQPLNSLGTKIIAPFWADVDTRNTNSDVVRYGTNVVDGHIAFGVDWVNVGYFVADDGGGGGGADKLFSCQLVIIDRSDIATNDFDMEFNYDKAQWGWGNDSGEIPPRAGYSDGGTNFYELPGSGVEGPGSEPGVEGAFLDVNFDTGLIYHSMDGPRTNLLTSPVSGRYRFYFRNGFPLP